MYRLIALDIDGTLFSSDQQILPSTIHAIRQARAKGVRVVLCTGRSAPEAAELSQMAGCDDRAVCLSGGVIGDMTTGQPIRQFPLDPLCVKTALKILKPFALHTILFADQYNLITPDTKKDMLQFLPRDIVHSHTLETEDLAKGMEGRTVCKLFSYASSGDVTPAAAALAQTFPGLVTNCGINLELLAPGVSKGSSLSLLAADWGIDMEDVIAIGDSNNDLGMLSVAGMPVAMGNASADAKAAAKLVTDTNDNDGIAKALTQLLDL